MVICILRVFFNDIMNQSLHLDIDLIMVVMWLNGGPRSIMEVDYDLYSKSSGGFRDDELQSLLQELTFPVETPM